MMTISGNYSTAKIYTDEIEESAADQIRRLCSQKFAEGSRIRIMPDVHAGAGCVIGFTADLGEMVIPNIVGVDIGCGMLTVELGKRELDYGELDRVINNSVPCGRNIHPASKIPFPALEDLNCFGALKNVDRIRRSIGTLGGGNHFIEIDEDDDGLKYLVIHTGSRNLGKQVAEYYQSMAFEILSGRSEWKEERTRIIEEYRAAGRNKELQKKLKERKAEYEEKGSDIPRELCYLTGKEREDYLTDMKICQEYAAANRRTIAGIILKELFGASLEEFPYFETIHNYIDHESNIVRKGAVSAKKGEWLLIPINMRDGSLICVGKGNEDWNFSAPHGAGRLYSRGGARKNFTMEEFRASMAGIYTTSVDRSTLDECPMAYKDMRDIIKHIGPTAEIIRKIRPVYNFKAAE